MKKIFKKVLTSKGFYMLLILGVVCIATNSYVNHLKNFADQTKTYKTGTSPSIRRETNAIKPKVTDNSTAKKAVPASKTEEEEDAAVLSFTTPLNGEIIGEFSNNELVFNKTMNDWRTHNGIDIAAAVGTAVKAAEKGKVTFANIDGLNGFTVVIEHKDGYITRYCSLEQSDMVSVGTTVSKGQVIGGVGTTGDFEISLSPHLHFEMLKDSKYINPAVKIKD